MKQKTMAILAYITLIGWIISYLEFKKSTEKSTLVNYHLGQSLGLIITSILLSIVSGVVLAIIPSLGSVFYLILLIPFVLLLLGIIAANNEVEKPLPLIGKVFEGKFNFAS
ncbi:import component protein [Sphingobacteriaceae bacterium GW460-11-11-14-LB5]|nr:import component protein [Sphingobacteriaceae bacterium GW460-11-11-14-LB5]